MEGDQLVTQLPDRLAVLPDVGYEEDLLDPPRALLADMGHRLAEKCGEAHQVLVAEPLPAEEDDAVVEQGAAHPDDLNRGQRLGQVAPGDLCPEGAAGRPHAKVVAALGHLEKRKRFIPVPGKGEAPPRRRRRRKTGPG